MTAGHVELGGDLAGELADRIDMGGQCRRALGDHRHQDIR